MSKFLKIFNLFLLSFWLLPLAEVQADDSLSNTQFSISNTELNDTVKYQGYRLDLLNFEVLKRTDDWVKVRFSVVNSGRMHVNLGKKGTEHWVQINFDRSLFDAKLGGLRQNIEYELARSGFKLPAGESRRKVELKVPTLLPADAQQPRNEAITIAPKPKEKKEPVDVFANKGSSERDMPVHPNFQQENPPIAAPKDDTCPDISFVELRIVSQDNKWATVQYTIINEGTRDFQLYGQQEGREDNLVLRAYISGVEKLSRGAIPIGGKFIQETAGTPQVLRPNEQYSGRLKLDVRKKTRYLKSLIIKLDSQQYAIECDRTNNTAAVILD